MNALLLEYVLRLSTGGIDNKDIYDDGQAQRLNRDEITALKQEGASAKEIVEQLMENSSTFKERTEYSQAKYIKRKLIRHRPRVTIVRPSTRLVCEMCWTRSPSKSLFVWALFWAWCGVS